MVQWKIAAAAVLAAAAGACIVTSSRTAELPGLAGLEIRVTAGAAGPLTPPFSRGTFHYRMDVQSDVASVIVVPRADGSGSRITVGDAPVGSGQPCSVSLAVGDNPLTIQVSDRADRVAAYSVRVNRGDIAPIAARFARLSWRDDQTGVTLGYRLFVPGHAEPGQRFPLVLFLHGAGESGSDNEAQLLANEGATVWAKPSEQARHPCFVLAPQNPKDPAAALKGDFGRQGWTSLLRQGPSFPFSVEPSLHAAYALLQRVMAEYPVDPDRVYATGLSMGGFGVYALAAEHPRTFAAVVGICGGLDPQKAAVLARTPVWVFHAADDPIVPVRFSRNTVDALRKAGGRPRYTEYGREVFFSPDAHCSWVPAYASPELRAWLFEQHRSP